MRSLLLSLVLPSVRTNLLGDALAFGGVRVIGDEALKGSDPKVLIWMCAAEADLRLVHGAFPFGCDRNIARKVDYLAVVSHPVRRVLGEYALVCRKEGHPLYPLGKASGGDIAVFLRDPGSAPLRNRQTVALAGAEGEGLGSEDPRLLALALRNLRERFLWVGCAETLSAAAKGLVELLGEKVSPGNGESVQAHRDVEAANALDMELHRICAEGRWK